MKKFLLLLSLVFASVTAFAQKSLNYQAVIMDPKPIEIPGTNITGQPLKNGKVSVRFALISKAGVDYEELHETMTDEFGLINLTIGAGLVNSSGIASNATTIAYKSFQAVKWDSNVKQLKVSLSFDTGKNFTVVSSQPFNYAAYSLYAESVEYENVRNSPTTLSFFNNDVGYILISQGTSAPVWGSQTSDYLTATDNANGYGETWSSKSGSVYTYSFPLNNTPLNTSFEIYRYSSSSTSTGSKLRAYDANNFTSGWRYDSATKTIYYSSNNSGDTYMFEIVYYK